MGELYRITAPSGKAYIGITSKTAQKRFLSHCYCGSMFPIIKEYGRENMIVEVLVVGEINYLADLERKAIAAFGTLAPFGYNRHPGGDHLSDATRAKLSLVRRGKTLSKEHRAKISAANRIRVVSPETRAKMADNNRKRVITAETRAKLHIARLGNKSHSGRPPSPETRAKISSANKMAWAARRARENKD